MKRINILAFIPACALLAANGSNGTTGVTPANAMEVRTLSEKVPAGGTVQVKFLLTQPRPIASGGSSFFMNAFSIDGVSIFSPSGQTAGAAVVNNGTLYLSVISPDSGFGTNLDYPFLTLTLDIPASAPTGSITPLQLGNAVFQGPSGPLTFSDPKPGTLTIGGSISVRGVFPGGGTQPAGTVISVRGTGFVPGTKVATKMKTSNPVYVSSTEMRFTLLETTTMDTQSIQATNPDGSQVVFFSYLRGLPLQVPSRALWQQTEPVFQAVTHALATMNVPSLANGQFVGLAVQNPTTGPAVVTFYQQRTGATANVMLAPGQRVMDDLAVLLGGAGLTAGDAITISATSAVQILGLLGDENAWTVAPFLPSF